MEVEVKGRERSYTHCSGRGEGDRKDVFALPSRTEGEGGRDLTVAHKITREPIVLLLSQRNYLKLSLESTFSLSFSPRFMNGIVKSTPFSLS